MEKSASLKRLFTLGLFTPKYERAKGAWRDASAPWDGSRARSFEPEAWKPNYPNTAFSNMQPDDAFWGARLVSRFSDEAIRAIVEQAGYDDPEAVQYLARTLMRRRDLIARAWLNSVNPIVDVSLAPSGALTFSNAAVAARVATPGVYTIAWSRFDNNSGTSERISVEERTEPRGTAPPALLADADYIEATIWSRAARLPWLGAASARLFQARGCGLADRRARSGTEHGAPKDSSKFKVQSSK